MSNKEIGKNYEIKGEDFTIIIKPTNSPPLPIKLMLNLMNVNKY
jgi:hypothetical protein